MAGRPAANPEVDRTKVCPTLLRVFFRVNGHHRPEDFAERGKEPTDEIQIHTWPDATLRELADLIKEVRPVARRRTARLSFAFAFPDQRSGQFLVKELSVVHNSRTTPTDTRTLRSYRFQPGDYLDVAVYV